MPDGAVKCPTGLSNFRLYGGNVKSNALGLPGGGLIAAGGGGGGHPKFKKNFKSDYKRLMAFSKVFQGLFHV